MNVDEIDNLSETNPVYQVAEGATKEQRVPAEQEPIHFSGRDQEPQNSHQRDDRHRDKKHGSQAPR